MVLDYLFNVTDLGRLPQEKDDNVAYYDRLWARAQEDDTVVFPAYEGEDRQAYIARHNNLARVSPLYIRFGIER